MRSDETAIKNERHSNEQTISNDEIAMTIDETAIKSHEIVTGTNEVAMRSQCQTNGIVTQILKTTIKHMK